MRQIDGYCERLDASFWAEPVNAVTNAAFLVAAWVMWRRVRGQGEGLATALVAILALIGIGSFLFHTFAQIWAALADTLPILAFILVYIFAINRDVWQMRPWLALGLTLLFLPYAAATAPLFGLVPGLGGSSAYAPVPLLILIYAFLLRRRAPATARGLVAGAMVLCLSILFRALDEPLCGVLPGGTHFLWHILNALMLAWMIEVYHRHLAAARSA